MALRIICFSCFLKLSPPVTVVFSLDLIHTGHLPVDKGDSVTNEVATVR
jgi:hypothetical protein